MTDLVDQLPKQTIELRVEGKSYWGTFAVLAGLLSVKLTDGRCKTVAFRGDRPKDVAEMLMSELVLANLLRGNRE